MARLLSSDSNTLRVQDNISGSELELYYRTPTTEEYAGYQNERIIRKGRKIKSAIPQARFKYGLKIMTGFRTGDFVIPGEDGKPVPIASDQKSEHFRLDWPDLMEKYASDIVQLLAAHVFDGSAEIRIDDEKDEEEKGDAESD